MNDVKLKKILIISYFFPPCNLVGAQRPYSWFRYFHEFGLYPVVITRHWNREVKTLTDASLPDEAPLKIEKHDWGEVHYLPYSGTLRDRFLSRFGNRFALVRKALTAAELFLQFLFFRFNPYRFFYSYAESLIEKEEDFHALIISGNPFPQFAVGYRLNRKYNLPWVADYRDDWTTNKLNPESSSTKGILYLLARHSEKKWTGTARFFISVTDEYISRISDLTGMRGCLVLNGFEDQAEFPSPECQGTLNLLYAGSIYPNQDFGLLAQGLEKFMSENPSATVKLIFAGSLWEGRVPPAVERIRPILNRVEIFVLPRQSEAEFLHLVGQAHIPFTVPYGSEHGVMSAKLFHYLSWNRPVLLAGTDHGVMEETLKPYSAAYVCETAEQTAQALQNIYERLRNGTFSLTDQDRQYIQRFTRRNQARILADLLKGEV